MRAFKACRRLRLLLLPLLLLSLTATVRGALDRAAEQKGATLGRALRNTPSWHPKRYRKHQAERADGDAGAEVDAAGADAQTSQPQSHAHLKLEAARQAAQGPVPSWWECSSCKQCLFGPNDAPPPAERHNTIGSCPLCSGCTHDLEMLNLNVPMSKAKIKVIKMHYGNTGASLFLATDVVGQEAVLKMHGVATPMVTAGKMTQLLRLYRGKRYLAHELLLARALAPLAEACGLGHINIKEWVAYVRAVIPVTGEKVEEPRAVLAEYARGVSLEMLTLKLSSPDLLNALAAVPHAALRDAALFDLLFVQGDRHAENVFLGDDGYLKLIDSRDSALEDGLDSVFFASTITFERNRVGNEHMFNRSKPMVTHHWAQNTLDYRCHVPGGAIGKNFPPKFKECITKYAAAAPVDIEREFFSHALDDAAAVGSVNKLFVSAAIGRLQTQSRLMLESGFEAALLGTNHKNATGKVPFRSGFPTGEPCCEVVLLPTSRPAYGCTPNGHNVLPADYQYPPLDLSHFVAQYPHSPMPDMPPVPKLNEEHLALLAQGHPAVSATVVRREAAEQPAPAGGAGAPATLPGPRSAADNRADWVRRLGSEDIVAAGGDVFDVVPAAGFDPAFKNPCWRNATGMYCLPYFHIIGVSKCGTTDLFRRLCLHPHLAPSHNKGPHFWDERHTVDWYLKIYELAVDSIQKDPAHAIIGDASSNTLTYSGVGVRNDRHPPGGVSLAAVLAALQPQLRLIALLRNPVDRMYSAYYYYGHYAQRYGADPDGFHKYAVLQITAYETCPATATRRECAVQGYGSAEQLTKGLYAMFLPDYFAAFPREQLLVMRSEAYGDDTEGGLRAAMAHIGLDAPPPEVWGRMVEGKRSNSRASNGSNRGGAAGEMRADTRALLNAFYRPFNEELAALLKDDGYLSWHLEEPQAAQ